MALVMVQGHVFDALLSGAARELWPYRWQLVFHGSTAPGFLFASGFVAGLPRAPLSLKASLRRARRLLFVWGVGYALHLPYLSLAKTVAASPAERTAATACDALHVIAVSQLFVLALQWLFRGHWTAAAGGAGLAVVCLTPGVWSSGVAARLPLAIGAYLDGSTGSLFPVFPFAAFVFAGTIAGAGLGRQDPPTRWRRGWAWGGSLVALGAALSLVLHGRVEFWGPSPAYVCLRLGGLIGLLLGVERAARGPLPAVRALALLGHETLLVYVLHLWLLFGGVLGGGPLAFLAGRLGFAGVGLTLLAMVPVLFAAAWLWHSFKVRRPHAATLVLAFATTAFVWDFLTRPW